MKKSESWRKPIIIQGVSKQVLNDKAQNIVMKPELHYDKFIQHLLSKNTLPVVRVGITICKIKP